MTQAFVSVVMLVLAFVAIYLLSTWSCSAKADAMQLPHDYAVLQGCMIKVEGRWIPLESYRTVD